jgi:hypothetical protein
VGEYNTMQSMKMGTSPLTISQHNAFTKNDDLSGMFPTSFGKKAKSAPKAPARNGEAEADWDALRSFMPMSFGKQEKKKDTAAIFEKTKRQVSISPCSRISSKLLILLYL